VNKYGLDSKPKYILMDIGYGDLPFVFSVDCTSFCVSGIGSTFYNESTGGSSCTSPSTIVHNKIWGNETFMGQICNLLIETGDVGLNVFPIDSVIVMSASACPASDSLYDGVYPLAPTTLTNSPNPFFA